MRRIASLLLTALAVSCGKSGPPLPPLARLPIAPANLTAEHRGDRVDLAFTVPDANTDRTRPANIARVDVYAITGAATVTDDQLLKRGTRVASVDVKSPKDPNQAAAEDEPVDDVEPAVGAGLDQGAVAHLSETLAKDASTPVDLSTDGRRKRGDDAEGSGRPLLGPAGQPARIYAAVGVSARGKRGPFSSRVSAPLADPPPAPGTPAIAYTESAVTISWPASGASAPATDGVLPARPLGVESSAVGYNVYDVSASEPYKITKSPVTDTMAVDSRISWGDERCYVIRAARQVSGVTIESAPSPAACEMLVDTFPPAAPKALRSVAGDGVINLIWDANTESDLAGYFVFRASGDAPLTPITSEPIRETTFTDTVPPGIQFTYAVKAIDRAGNASGLSEHATDAAR